MTLLTFGVQCVGCNREKADRFCLNTRGLPSPGSRPVFDGCSILQERNYIVRTDQCAFGQTDSNGQQFITNTNNSVVAKALKRDCSGKRKHVHCIGQINGGARAAAAARYPSRMVDAVNLECS